MSTPTTSTRTTTPKIATSPRCRLRFPTSGPRMTCSNSVMKSPPAKTTTKARPVPNRSHPGSKAQASIRSGSARDGRVALHSSIGYPDGGGAMAEKKQMVVYAASYETVDAALGDLNAIEQLHKDEMIGQYDAAVIDKKDGKPHVAQRRDRPRGRVIPDGTGGGTR